MQKQGGCQRVLVTETFFTWDAHGNPSRTCILSCKRFVPEYHRDVRLGHQGIGKTPGTTTFKGWTTFIIQGLPDHDQGDLVGRGNFRHLGNVDKAGDMIENHQRIGDGPGRIADGKADMFGTRVYRQNSCHWAMETVILSGTTGSQGHQPGWILMTGEPASGRDPINRAIASDGLCPATNWTAVSRSRRACRERRPSISQWVIPFASVLGTLSGSNVISSEAGSYPSGRAASSEALVSVSISASDGILRLAVHTHRQRKRITALPLGWEIDLRQHLGDFQCVGEKYIPGSETVLEARVTSGKNI